MPPSLPVTTELTVGGNLEITEQKTVEELRKQQKNSRHNEEIEPKLCSIRNLVKNGQIFGGNFRFYRHSN